MSTEEDLDRAIDESLKPEQVPIEEDLDSRSCLVGTCYGFSALSQSFSGWTRFRRWISTKMKTMYVLYSYEPIMNMKINQMTGFVLS